MAQMPAGRYPVYILMHPIDGFQEMKYNRKQSIALSWALLAVWFVGEIFAYQKTGFIFNYNKTDELNVYLILVKTVLVFTLWCVSNWAICTLMDGEGRFTDIWVASAYALLPYLFSIFIVSILSNFLIAEEGVFLTYLTVAGQLWSAFVLFCGIQVIHAYSFKKTVFSILLTLLGIVVIVFLGVLLFSLFQQLYIFVYTVISEIKFRM